MPEPLDPNRTAAASQAQNASASDNADETSAASAARSADTPHFGPPASAGEVGTLGPYHVLKELGKGGMGAVYLALDTRLDRKLALKVMLPAFAADAGAKERFLREARAAAKISHDNVVTVFEADERDGVPYIAMQFLQGYPLDEYLKKKGPPALTHVIRIARETAIGLSAAHALGLVHRDIKPANLWLEAPNGRVKVLDFGLARAVDAEAELTKSGAVVGTPAYMSPEQARGLKVDHRTDLFSLGGVLYRLCTGRTPFNGPNVMAVLMALGTEEPTPLRELNPNVPDSLAALIHQLLAKKPEQRPQSATEVAKRLRAILEQSVAGGTSAAVSNAAVPMASAPDLSTSQPVVVNPVPVLPPNVVPMQITVPPESVFADIGADEANDDESDATETDARPAPREPKPKPERKKSGGKGMLIAAVVAVLLAVIAVAVVVSKTGKKGEPEASTPDAPVDPNKGAKAAPRGWEPPKPGTTIAPGPSPFDALDPAKIPEAERGPWLPTSTVAVLGGHAGMYGGALGSHTASLSPDGKWVAAANEAGLWIWDAATLRPRFHDPHHAHALAFSPDGKRVAFSRGDRVRLIALDGSDPKFVNDLVTYGSWQNTNRANAFLPDNKTLITGTGHGGIYLWDVTGPGDQPIRVIRKETGFQKGAINKLCLSADGTKVIISAYDDDNNRHIISGHTVADGKELFAFPSPAPVGHEFVASPAGDRIVSLREAGGKREAVIRDVTGAQPKELGATTVPDSGPVSFARDGKTIFFAGGQASFWELDGGALQKIRDLPPGTVTIAPDLSRILQVKDRRLRLLDKDGKTVVEPGEAVTINEGTQHQSVSANGTVVTTLPNTRLWTVKNGALVAGPPALGPNPVLLGVSASPDGSILTALSDGRVLVYAIANHAVSREVLLNPPGVPEGELVTWYNWHPDGKSLLTVRRDGTFDLWDVTVTPPTKKPFPALGRGESLGAFAPAGDYIVVRKESDLSSPVLRPLANPKAERTLLSFSGERWTSAAFTPDGKALLVSYTPEGDGKECRVRRFDMTKPNAPGETFATFPWVASQYPYLNLNVSRDGTKLLAYTGTQVRVFDVATRTLLLSVPLADGFGLLHSFTRWADDGRHLLLSSNNGLVCLLRVPNRATAE